MTVSSQFNDAFKENYNDGSQIMEEQQNLNAPFWKTIKVSSLKPSERGIYNPIVVEGNENGGAINESESFQEPGAIVPVGTQIKDKLVVWPFQVSGKLIRQSETNKQAFAQGLDAQQKDNLSRMNMDLERQAWGTGTGQITLANGLGSGATALIVDDVTGFRQGMYIDGFASLGGAKEIDGIKISAVNITTNTLTLATASTWSDNAIICKKGVCNGVTSLANAKEITGWRAICDTTTYSTTFENVVTSTYTDFRGNVIDASSAPVSQDFLQRAQDQTVIKSGMKPNKLVSNHGQARNFKNTEIQKTRYEAGEVKAGAVKMMWNDMEWVVYHTYPRGEVGLMNTEYIEKFQCRDVHLSDLPGYSLYQIVGKDAIGGYYAYEGNLGTWKRNAHTRIINLSEPTY